MNLYKKIKNILIESEEDDSAAKLPEHKDIESVLAKMNEEAVTAIKNTIFGKPAKKPASPTSPLPHNLPKITKPKALTNGLTNVK